MQNVMLDLETLGLRKNAVVLSLGAVAFDLNAAPGKYEEMRCKFHRGLAFDDQIEVGRLVDGSTFKFWMMQSEVARKRVESMILTQRGTREVLCAFASWLRDMSELSDGDIKVWCKGSDNDLAWLGSLYDDFKVDRPWRYNNTRDIRSFTELMLPEDWAHQETVAHDALQDSIDQATALQRFHQRMGWGHA